MTTTTMVNDKISSVFINSDDKAVTWEVDASHVLPEVPNAPRVYILRGIPGSGKSTVARKAAQTVEGTTVVSRDAIRSMIYGAETLNKGFGNISRMSKADKERYFATEDSITETCNSMIRTAITAGKNVIVDNTHVKAHYVSEVINLATELGVNVTILSSVIDVSTAIKRVNSRTAQGGHTCPEFVIRNMFDSYMNSRRSGEKLGKNAEHYASKAVARMKGYDFNPYIYAPVPPVFNSEFKKSYIFDIDGTLALMVPNEHGDTRSPFDFDRVNEDAVNEPVADTLRELYNNGYEIIIMSGRNEECRNVTEKWLDDNNIPRHALYMRPEGDKRDDSLVKRDLLVNVEQSHAPVVAAFDDRDRVVKMWRKVGIACFQVNYGDF